MVPGSEGIVASNGDIIWAPSPYGLVGTGLSMEDMEMVTESLTSLNRPQSPAFVFVCPANFPSLLLLIYDFPAL